MQGWKKQMVFKIKNCFCLFVFFGFYGFYGFKLWFLRASALLKHVIAIGWTSIRPSVRLSHAWHCAKTAEHIIVMLSSPHDSPFILVLCISRSSRNSDGVTPCGAAKQRWDMNMSQFSTNNLLYLGND